MFGQLTGQQAGMTGTTQRGAEALSLPWCSGERG